MVRQFLKNILAKPLGKLADKYDSRPDAARVFPALSALNGNIKANPGKKGPIITFDENSKFIILSDQHKGAKNGSDIFALAEANYTTALDHYNSQNYTYINLGDGEELWQNTISKVKQKHKTSFIKEKLFADRNAFIKIFGNHDLYWDNDPLAAIFLQKIYKQKITIYEGAILQTHVDGKPLDIFLTHGHQGDLQSDGNWFSKFFIGKIWGPLQMYLQLNLNTPSVDDHIKTLHNTIMFNWSAQQTNTLLITGHTHQPVFGSLTHLERLYHRLDMATVQNDKQTIANIQQLIGKHVDQGSALPSFKGYKPTYFNSGCCCFDDGDITGIEISGGCIRLIKWKYDKKASVRIILEEMTLKELADAI